jgi:hypothetical protein
VSPSLKFACDYDNVTINHHLYSTSSGRILTQDGINDFVSDLVGNFVWMTSSSGLSCS